MKPLKLNTPLGKPELVTLHCGDLVLLSGTVYAARDTAHKRLQAAVREGSPLPFDLAGAVIYYVGPSPTPPGRAIGSAGPTTSYRMDAYAPDLHRLGLAASIGKGKRSPELRRALQENHAVYFGAAGGAAALLSRHITASEVIAYPDLGPEAILRLTFQDFPLIVLYDSHGADAFPAPVLPGSA